MLCHSVLVSVFLVHTLFYSILLRVPYLSMFLIDLCLGFICILIFIRVYSCIILASSLNYVKKSVNTAPIMVNSLGPLK